MNMLYDSDEFSVLHILANAADPGDASLPSGPQLPRHGFEIVDKRSGKEVYLDGSWAEVFQAQIDVWQLSAPSQEEVDGALDRYAGLAQMPIHMH